MYCKKIILDTDNKPTINLDGSLTWYVSNSKNFQEGYVYLGENIKNIVGIRLSPTRWEKTPEPYNTGNLLRYTILIDELSGQSFISGDKNFHFMLSASGLSDIDTSSAYYYLDLMPANKGYYWFNNPITELTKLTLSFGSPFNSFRLRTQYMRCRIVQQSNPQQFISTDNPANANYYYEQPYYAVGEIVYIQGFTTGNTTTDQAFIANFDTARTVNTISADGFTVNLNASGVVSSPNILYVVVKTLRFRSIFSIDVFYNGKEEHE